MKAEGISSSKLWLTQGSLKGSYLDIESMETFNQWYRDLFFSYKVLAADN